MFLGDRKENQGFIMEFNRNIKAVDVQQNPLSVHLPTSKSHLTRSQGELILSIFRGHVVHESGMFLTVSDMDSVYNVLHSEKNVSPKQKLREWCLSGTATLHKIICNASLPASERALSQLPGTLESFIDRLTELQAKMIFIKLIDRHSGELKEKSPGKIFLNAIIKRDILLLSFLSSAGVSCSAIFHGLQKRGESGKTALMYAASQGEEGCVYFLLQAARHNHLRRRLLSHTNGLGQTALMQAVLKGNLEVVKILLESVDRSEARLNLLKNRDINGWTLFMGAAHSGSVEVMRFLVEMEPPESRARLFTDRSDLGSLPFMLATSAEAVEFLLERGVALGADAREEFFRAVDMNGATALMHALVAIPDDISSQDTVVRALLELGANPADPDPQGETVLMALAHLGKKEATRIFLRAIPAEERFALLNQRDIDGKTPLIHAAAGEGNPEVLRVLFNAASVENRSALLLAQSNEGGTALMWARSTEHGRLLIEMATEVGCVTELLAMRDVNGETALFEAVSRIDVTQGPEGYERQLLERIQLLLHPGADPADQNEQGITTLMLAVFKKNADLLHLLLESVRPERRIELLKIKNSFGQTALMYATCHSELRMLRLLFDSVSLANRSELLLAQTHAGITALMMARTTEITSLLLTIAKEVGCLTEILTACTSNGNMALFLAIERECSLGAIDWYKSAQCT